MVSTRQCKTQSHTDHYRIGPGQVVDKALEMQLEGLLRPQLSHIDIPPLPVHLSTPSQAAQVLEVAVGCGLNVTDVADVQSHVTAQQHTALETEQHQLTVAPNPTLSSDGKQVTSKVIGSWPSRQVVVMVVVTELRSVVDMASCTGGT